MIITETSLSLGYILYSWWRQKLTNKLNWCTNIRACLRLTILWWFSVICVYLRIFLCCRSKHNTFTYVRLSMRTCLCCRSKHIHVREVIHPKIWVSHVPSSRQIIGEAGGCSVEGGGDTLSLELSVSSSAVSPPQGCGGCGWFHVNCNISLQFQQPYLYSIRKTENIYCAPAFPHLENRHNYFYQTSSWMWRQIKMGKV